MKQSDLALKWYRPCELQALASWLPWAALVNLLVLGGESPRDDGSGMGITAAGPIALALARIALPDGAHGFKLLACLGCVLSALLLDGCSQIQVFRKIVLPLSLPAMGVTALFSFLVAWNEYLLAMVFNTSRDKYTLPVGLASMIPVNNQLWGDFAAGSVLVSIPVAVLFIAFQKSLVQGLTLGGVKG